MKEMYRTTYIRTLKMMGFLICKDEIISSVTNLVDVAVNAMTGTSGMAFLNILKLL